VAGCPPKKPSPKFFDRWQKVPIKSDILREGLQAIQWTADERGLAGLGELEGIPWMMRMEQFFEGWLESLVKRAAMLTGGIVKSGRLKQTVAALSWDPAFVGSQRSLIPDLVVEREDQVIIFDAKYKQHWEEIREKPWWKIEEDIKEQHRIDLFQILAYSTLFSRQNIIACLVYPCSLKTWESLKTRGRLSHRAFLGFENRRISLLFTAVPMAGNMTDIVDELIRLLKNAL
jgi:5-methylcytosine-specific restriction endonuclease McrBC regulatory subunit McrC